MWPARLAIASVLRVAARTQKLQGMTVEFLHYSAMGSIYASLTHTMRFQAVIGLACRRPF